MKTAIFSTKSYDQRFFTLANDRYHHDLHFLEPHLTPKTSTLAQGFPAICVFVNDQLNAETLQTIAQGGTQLIALRCAGFNNVDVRVATALGLTIVRVPSYSPYAVAEHTIALILTLNRKLHRAYNRVREGNFSLEGLLGFDLHDRTVGIFGTGKIGKITAQILKGFGCRVLGYDRYPDPQFEQQGGQYVTAQELIETSDIISLHCPLTPETHHLINAETIEKMKTGVMLINTSRGGLIDTQAVITGLKSGKIGYLAIDVYEQETDLFFENLSDQIIQDDVFQRLLTFPNVLITGHQAFFTEEALHNIAETTLANIQQFERGEGCPHQVTLDLILKM